MINKGINRFIEIGPGSLSGLVKRINRCKISTINKESDIRDLKL